MSSKLLEELKRRYDPFIVKNYLIKKYAASGNGQADEKDVVIGETPDEIQRYLSMILEKSQKLSEFLQEKDNDKKIKSIERNYERVEKFQEKIKKIQNSVTEKSCSEEIARKVREVLNRTLMKSKKRDIAGWEETLENYYKSIGVYFLDIKCGDKLTDMDEYISEESDYQEVENEQEDNVVQAIDMNPYYLLFKKQGKLVRSINGGTFLLGSYKK